MVNKLKRLKVEEKLKSLGFLVFSPREFQGVFGVPASIASVFINRNLRSGLFQKLRNGYYLVKDSHPSQYVVANKLYQPSYVSLEKALSHYGIIPEVVYGQTSVTTKISREIVTPLGLFTYQRIKQPAFTGYSLRQVDSGRALIAEPEKALADYLYFVDLKRISLNDRLNLKKIRRAKLLEYVALFQRPNMRKLVSHIYAHARKPRKIY
jgi:predicted transcriptional regulator of viral defense system